MTASREYDAKIGNPRLVAAIVIGEIDGAALNGMGNEGCAGCNLGVELDGKVGHGELLGDVGVAFQYTLVFMRVGRSVSWFPRLWLSVAR